jgi:hypothetical protein
MLYNAQRLSNLRESSSKQKKKDKRRRKEKCIAARVFELQSRQRPKGKRNLARK